MKMIIVLPILFLLLVGCATTTNMKIIDPTGRELPTPHYVLQSSSTNLTATFFYASMSQVKDTDGTIIYHPTYLPMTKIYKATPATKLLLVIEVSNPKKIQYKFWSEMHITYWKKSRGRYNSTFAASQLAKSKMEYRQFIFDMPVSEKIKKVSYGVNLFDQSGNILMYFGDFHYQIKRR